MTDLIRLSSEDDIETHICELHVVSETSSNQDLGFISKSSVPLKIKIRDDEFLVEQSPELLQSNTISSTTGFVAWKVSPPFLEWLIYHQQIFPITRDSNVLELGSGSAGIVASCLGKHCKHFVASDQRPLLKSLKRNIINNMGNFETSTIDQVSVQRNKKNYPIIDVIELDWEEPEFGVQQLQLINFKQDIIIACDTIYNEYLIPFFLDSLKELCNKDTTVLLAIHLRDIEIVEFFLKKCIESFEVRYVDEDYLTDEMKNGFAIYYLKKIQLI